MLTARPLGHQIIIKESPLDAVLREAGEDSSRAKDSKNSLGLRPEN